MQIHTTLVQSDLVKVPAEIQRIEAAGYDGWLGAEYKPRAGTLEGLGWAKPYGIG